MWIKLKQYPPNHHLAQAMKDDHEHSLSCFTHGDWNIQNCHWVSSSNTFMVPVLLTSCNICFCPFWVCTCCKQHQLLLELGTKEQREKKSQKHIPKQCQVRVDHQMFPLVSINGAISCTTMEVLIDFFLILTINNLLQKLNHWKHYPKSKERTAKDRPYKQKGLVHEAICHWSTIKHHLQLVQQSSPLESNKKNLNEAVQLLSQDASSD